jgi:hypothetical protein
MSADEKREALATLARRERAELRAEVILTLAPIIDAGRLYMTFEIPADRRGPYQAALNAIDGWAYLGTVSDAKLQGPERVAILKWADKALAIDVTP